MKMSALILPSLRGQFGDWVFYSCLMPVSELVDRVNFAEEIHQSRTLADYIQRELKRGRAEDIAAYLNSQPQRFFNSLVVAVYGGKPTWHQLTSIISDFKIPNDAIYSMGLLNFSGTEKLFAIDGQHRIAGLRVAILDNDNLAQEELPIVLVAHKNTQAGKRRTRRLFTTLNKSAKPVSKGEIIALDEDDAMAIIVRRLLDNHKFFEGARILFTHTNNLPSNDKKSLTTIGNLYDVLGILFTKIGSAGSLKKLRYGIRPNDAELDRLYELANNFFHEMSRNFTPLRRFFDNKNFGSVVEQNRHENGGHVLFRPIGLGIFTQIIGELHKHTSSMRRSVAIVSKLPITLQNQPYVGVLWDPSKKVMTTGGRALTLRLLRHGLGLEKNVKKLKADYARALEKRPVDIKLPNKLKWRP